MRHRLHAKGSATLVALEHVPEKWLHFSDKDMLQLFELARILDRSADSIRSECALVRRPYDQQIATWYCDANGWFSPVDIAMLVLFLEV